MNAKHLFNGSYQYQGLLSSCVNPQNTNHIADDRIFSQASPAFPDSSALLMPRCHSLHKQRTEIEASRPELPPTPLACEEIKTGPYFRAGAIVCVAVMIIDIEWHRCLCCDCIKDKYINVVPVLLLLWWLHATDTVWIRTVRRHFTMLWLCEACAVLTCRLNTRYTCLI